MAVKSIIAKNIDNLTYDIFCKNDISLEKLKLPILKKSCKQYKLKVSGTKPILIERLRTFFNQTKNATTIQSALRMHQAKIYTNKRGPAVHIRKICNNSTDFVSLEPLEEIVFEYFYSYKDDNDFIYGFNLTSLLSLIKSDSKFINPYNRVAFSNESKQNIIALYNNTCIINAKFRAENEPFNQTIKPSLSRLPILHTISTVVNYNPRLDRNLQITFELNQRLNHLINIRRRNINERITQMFIEIDSLGNYTNASWFNSLTHMQYVRLYRCLFDIWVYRGQISYSIKKKICPFYDPFEGIFPRTIYHDAITADHMKKACLIVIENLVYSSADIEYRKIGALHALSALTIVSHSARLAMPWLFESIA